MNCLPNDIKNHVLYPMMHGTLEETIRDYPILQVITAHPKFDKNVSVIYASKYGHLEVVKYLVSLGANIHTSDDQAMRWASYKGHLEVLQYLVSSGANIRAYTCGMYQCRARAHYVMRLASSCDHLELVRHLSANDQTMLYTSLVPHASSGGHLEVVKYLVSLGADIRACDDDAVRWAISAGHLEVIQYLVSLGADVHAYGDQAVRLASLNGHLEVVQYLVLSVGAPTPNT